MRVEVAVRKADQPTSRGAPEGFVAIGSATTELARGPDEGDRQQPQRCAVYTRVSTENGLDRSDSLYAQREAAQAYVESQAHEGWKLIRDHYDDGGFSAAAWTVAADLGFSELTIAALLGHKKASVTSNTRITPMPSSCRPPTSSPIAWLS